MLFQPVDARQSWCPNCHAPFHPEHHIIPEGDEQPWFYLRRRDDTAACEVLLGTSRPEADRALRTVANDGAMSNLWGRYGEAFKSRALLDLLQR